MIDGGLWRLWQAVADGGGGDHGRERTGEDR